MGIQERTKEEVKKIMDKEAREIEKRISLRELEDEDLTYQMSVEEKKARIKELKRTYGSGWKKALNWMKSLRVDKETARNLYGDFTDLRKYSDPRSLR